MLFFARLPASVSYHKSNTNFKILKWETSLEGPHFNEHALRSQNVTRYTHSVLHNTLLM